MNFLHFYFKYKANEKDIYELKSSDFSVVENTHLKLEFVAEQLQNDMQYKVLLTAKVPLQLLVFEIETSFNYADNKGIFCNGFQSWTETKIFYNNEKLNAQRWPLSKIGEAYGDGLFYTYKNQKGILHSWTYTYIKQQKRKLYFLGSLNEQVGYTIFEHNAQLEKLLLQKDIEGVQVQINEELVLMNLFVANTNEQLAFQNYFEAQHLKPITATPAIGWTSWYYYYTKISETIIEQNLNAFIQENIPIDIFQIDDGWQQAVGDWLHINSKFPNGLTSIVNKIHKHNCKAGLWLAPFACEHNSFIVKEKPHWILKDEKGKFLKIGFNPLWSYWFYALDFYNEEVQTYLRTVFYTILHEWNFDLVKLDFLYGTAIVPRNGKSRGQIMHEAMQFLRDCVGDKMILGCGVPLSAANGTTEYCRIGPDIHLSWDFNLLKWIRARERPSTLNAIHNTISRRQLSGKWFWNDPDVFILRKNKTTLNFKEQYSLLLANLLFGHLLFTSDNISEYDASTLALYKSIFPLMEIENTQVNFLDEFYVINFTIKDKIYLALINTSNSNKRYQLPNNLFFDNVKQDLVTGDKLIDIPKHSSLCLLTVGYTPFAIAGSKGHFFSGTEIENIYLSGNKIELIWSENMLYDVKIFIKVPLEYEVLSVNDSVNFIRINKKKFSIIEVEKNKITL